jgi:hypothetical protein
LKTIYEKRFIQQDELGKIIIPFLIKRYQPKSFIEFGCSVGHFLKTIADSVKSNNYCGIDYTVPIDNLDISLDHFIRYDLSFPYITPLKYDMVISLEVAEHIPAQSSNIFVNSLCRHCGKFIMFSAATPGQGGDGHINEQPHEYWERKFEDHGFKKLDIIRPMLQDKKIIPSWYRNNIIIFERNTNE